MSTLITNALTTVADVKESMNIASSVSTYNNLIIRKINQATKMIENYTGRTFQSTVYTNDMYDATSTDVLVLRQRPVTAIASVQIRDSSLNDNSWDTVDSQLYFCDAGSAQANAGVLSLVFRAIGKWDRYRITYTAGYATIPEDLSEACAVLAAYYVTNADGAVTVKEKQEGSRKIQYYPGIKNFYDLSKLLGIDSTLDFYSNMPVQAER